MNNLALNVSVIQQWLHQNISIETASAELAAKGIEEPVIEAYIKEFKKQRYAKKQWKGFVLMGVGAFIGFIACIATMTDLVQELRGFFLYFLTTIAVAMVCWGMYYVFEE